MGQAIYVHGMDRFERIFFRLSKRDEVEFLESDGGEYVEIIATDCYGGSQWIFLRQRGINFCLDNRR